MADEPRRSGRATKGQHTKNDDELAPAAVTSTPVPSAAASTRPEPKSGKGKATKKGSNDEQEDEEDDDADTIIRCVCGATAEDELGFAMICCDKCEAWQHNLCMDMPEEEEDLPDKYYCEQCRPGNHKGLLAAMKRGENPAKERMERRLAEMERKRGKKGRGRKSGGKGTGTPAKGTPVPESVEGAGKVGKRKFEETPVEVKKSASPAVPTTTATPSLGRRKSSAQVVLPDAKRRKSTIDGGGGGHSRKSSVILPPVAADISDLPSNRQPAVKAVTAKSESVIKSLVKQGTYLLPSGSSANSLASALALQIENALIAIHGDPAGYKQQFMAILANIPKNTQLVLQLLEGQLTALEIAEMSSDDMANEDLQRERAKAIEQADKQAILITSAEGPRVRKTHKGDEIIGGEEVSRVLGSGGGDDASWGMRRARRDPSDEAMPDADEGSHHGDSEDRPELPDDAGGDDAPPRSLSVDTKPAAARKASTNYNMDRAWASAHSPTLATSGTYARVAQAQPAARRDTTMHDADIDRLLKDEASSDEDMREPSPQVGDGSPHAPVWKGRIDMAGVASFAASARWVAGGDVGAKVPGGFEGLLPAKLDITGRIAVARADEYVSGMRWSQSNDVCCLAITPSARRVERENFEKIYRYFSEKGRWGVISGLGDLVRDAYLVTLEKRSGAAFPAFLEGLDNQTVPREREIDALILTLVVKTKSPHPSPANAGITASTPTIPAQSPVIPSNGTTLPPTYPWATPLVLSILGEDVAAPAVVQLFTAVPDMTEEQMRNLKAALVQEPSARRDLGMLGKVLQGNADANGSGGGSL